MDFGISSSLAPYVAPFFLCCLVVAGFVEGTKRGVWIWLETHDKAKPKWLRHAWRLEALIVGGLSGLVGGIMALDLSWHDGFAVGMGAGLLSTSVIALVQRWLAPKSEK